MAVTKFKKSIQNIQRTVTHIYPFEILFPELKFESSPPILVKTLQETNLKDTIRNNIQESIQLIWDNFVHCSQIMHEQSNVLKK